MTSKIQSFKGDTCGIDFEARTSMEKFGCLLHIAVLFWKESSIETRTKSVGMQSRLPWRVVASGRKVVLGLKTPKDSRTFLTISQ
jgi:hypothetical protein